VYNKSKGFRKENMFRGSAMNNKDFPITELGCLNFITDLCHILYF